AEVFDLMLAGDGEEAFLEIVDKFVAMKEAGASRSEAVRELAAVRGAYVPSLYDAAPTEGSPLLVPEPRGDAPVRIGKRILETFRDSEFPEDIIVPSLRAVFDRVAVEAARGCPQNCRFCQAASLYFPYRVKDPDRLIRTMGSSLGKTGYEDASLTALSISDYPRLEETVRILMGGLEKRKISLSLSSLRPRGLSAEIVENIVKVRKTGFTLVPEAGTERLRRVINKKLDDREIHEALAYAFAKGWKLIKLYFMIGLPTETDEDLAGIVGLVRDIIGAGQRILGAPPRIHLSVSSFIPKPHTAFQWAAMDDGDTLAAKQEYLRAELRRSRSVEFKRHPVEVSLLEAAFSRGDRRLNGVLRTAWAAGARFDSWGDRFEPGLWAEAFSREGVDPGVYRGALDTGARLPWDHMETGIRKAHLVREYQMALEGTPTPTCLETTCGPCAACDLPHLRLPPRSSSAGPSATLREPPVWGTPSAGLERYRAVYSKRGNARFLSHIDLIHVLERAFRRARVEVAKSQGFHPKMLMSYGPALALGMEGLAEPLEFRAPFLYEAAAFVRRMNRALPPGIRITGVERLGPEAPPLSRVLKGAIYALDLKDPEIEEAFGRDGRRPGIRVLRSLVSGYEARKPTGVVVAPYWKIKKLLITIPLVEGKSPRPQDIAGDLFGIEGAVYALTRERFVS
ncbi:MAG TPA: TIGR03936 family radical SAM-associated protein, partial [Acidobacteriota bacterium]|nr:TIGR03936 family radical SAM-associated protein [Acidobacteriota bacterium]